MYTKYVFGNQDYEEAVQTLKATLFDIISMENAKVNELEEEIFNTVSEDKKSELEELRSRQQICLDNIMGKVNGLVSDIQELDSYSKQLAAINNQNIQEIIESLKSQGIKPEYYEGVSKAYDKDVNELTRKRDDTYNNIEHEINEMDVYDDLKDSMNEDLGVIKNGPSYESGINSNEIREGTYEEEVSEKAEKDLEVQDNPVVQEVSEQTEVQEEIPEEVSVQEVQEDYHEGEAISGAKDNAVENEVVQEDNQEPIIYETSEEVDTNQELVQEMLAESSVEVEAPVITAVSEVPEVAPQEQIVPAVTESEPVFEESSQVSEEASVAPSEIVSTDLGVSNESVSDREIELEPIDEAQETVDNQLQLAQENKKLIEQMSFAPRLKFKKKNNEITKAILTSKKQINNLRNSKRNQEILLKARGSIVSNSALSNTVAKIDEAVSKEKDFEEKLMNNGLLEQDTLFKQRQIETMLADAKVLFEEGKHEEAQAMYKKISELNEELQKAASVTK